MKRDFLINKLFLAIAIVSMMQCKPRADSSDPEPTDPVEELPNVAITLDYTVKYQTIDGFGFFGAKDVWWGSAANMWDEDWGEKVIADLGVSVWRNEIYPPAIPGANQDADWNKQRPVVEGLKTVADRHQVPLKFIATVWSPPADMKWAAEFSWVGDENATRWEDPSVTTKGGGTLNPNKYNEYAVWLNGHLQLYKDLGIDLYALSLQNEPGFSQSFNSCTYTVSWYNDLLVNVVPKIKAAFPTVRIFGSENMLLNEGRDEDWPWFYHSAIKANEAAAANIDILAVHGYSDGVLPNSGSELVSMWQNHATQFMEPMQKDVWMTETSGYGEMWDSDDSGSGAFSLGLDIMTALNHGNVSAWLWWQGSQLDGIGDYNLMNGLSTGKKYHVSKHYYRYIRPGAVRVNVTSADADVFVTAFEHADKGTTTIVIINAGDAKAISLLGSGLPEVFNMYRTSQLSTENCTFVAEVGSGLANEFTLPANSIVTLQAGGDAL